jgi:hypothetical protein
MPVWHVSIAVQKSGGPAPIWRVDQIERGQMRGLAISLSRGIGQGEDFWKNGECAIHLRRILNAREISLLSPEWLSLPAIDEAG